MEPHEIIPLDPDEFFAAHEYASMVAENEFLEELPVLKSRLNIRGKTLRFSNVIENRYGLAIMRFFRGRKHDKGWSFIARFSAMNTLMRRMRQEKVIQPFIKEVADGLEFHRAVFDPAATHKLNATFDFSPASFVRTVQRIARRLNADAGESNASQRKVAESAARS
jgi:hypothetical protein